MAGHKGEGWYFVVTQENREPKPALKVLEDFGILLSQEAGGTPRGVAQASVVVCAYQAQDTIEECLRSLTGLD